jgi:hypothetical protein
MAVIPFWFILTDLRLVCPPQQRDFETAANRACDNQKNVCADFANNGTGSFKVGDCDQQSGESVPLKGESDGGSNDHHMGLENGVGTDGGMALQIGVRALRRRQVFGRSRRRCW